MTSEPAVGFEKTPICEPDLIRLDTDLVRDKGLLSAKPPQPSLTTAVT